MTLYETLLVTTAFFGVVTFFALISHLFDEGSRLLFFGCLCLFATFAYWTRSIQTGDFDFEDVSRAVAKLVQDVMGLGVN